MDTSLHIERIGSESIDPALNLLAHFFLEEGFETPEAQIRVNLTAMLASTHAAIFLAKQAGKSLGIATVTTSMGLEYGLSAELEDLFVLTHARGRGIATALIDVVCEWCHQQGCSVILVTVTPQGAAAHNLMDFYLQRGFVNTRRVLLERSLLKE
jgi:aminoglycoside 6'-N-acetyltransferase I